MKKLIIAGVLAVSMGLGVFFSALYLWRGKPDIPVIFVSAGSAGAAIAWVAAARVLHAHITGARIATPPIFAFGIAAMSALGSGVFVSVINSGMHVVVLASIALAFVVVLVVNNAYYCAVATKVLTKDSLAVRKVLLCFSSEFVAISLPIFLVAHLKII